MGIATAGMTGLTFHPAILTVAHRCDGSSEFIIDVAIHRVQNYYAQTEFATV